MGQWRSALFTNIKLGRRKWSTKASIRSRSCCPEMLGSVTMRTAEASPREAITGQPMPGGPSVMIQFRPRVSANCRASRRIKATSLPEFSAATPRRACTSGPNLAGAALAAGNTDDHRNNLRLILAPWVCRTGDSSPGSRGCRAHGGTWPRRPDRGRNPTSPICCRFPIPQSRPPLSDSRRLNRPPGRAPRPFHFFLLAWLFHLLDLQ